ncbi:MAG TPA: hypothetical protein VHO84_10945, partial [Syntrophorhabdaceae bacterium]|nr:hypothetical protein [Syntrophorhabdaceae bacterium]
MEPSRVTSGKIGFCSIFLCAQIVIACSCLLLAGCVGIPENVQPVTGFKLNSYLGKWYEIARLDNSFERGL